MARAQSASRGSNGNGKDPAKDLDAEIAALREDVAAITSTLADMVKYRRDEVKADARNAKDTAIEKGEKTIEAVTDNVQAAEDELKTMIREKPIIAVLAAAGAGYVLSKILRI